MTTRKADLRHRDVAGQTDANPSEHAFPRRLWLAGLLGTMASPSIRLANGQTQGLQLPDAAGTRDDAFAWGYRFVESPLESLAARLEAIRVARHSVEMAYYSVDAGIAATAILHELCHAADRGVSTRVIVDGLKTRLGARFQDYLRRRGVAIGVFRQPCLLRPRQTNRRLHSKLLVVDDNDLILGSRNLEDAHFCLDDEKSFIDLDLRLRGPVAAQARDYFDALWCSPDVEPGPVDEINSFAAPWRRLDRDPWEQAFDEAVSDADFLSLMRQASRRAAQAQDQRLDRSTPLSMATGGKIRLLHDCRADKKCRCFQQTVIELMDTAQRELWIESPYPAFGPEFREAIMDARRRGVRVVILTNSLRSTDQVNVYANYQNQKHRYIEADVELYEFNSPATLHVKNMVVDGQIGMIGSYNFDYRSDQLNLELAAVSNDSGLVSELGQTLRRRLRNTRRIHHSQGRNSLGPEPPLAKRIGMAVRRPLVPFYRRCL